MAKTIDLRKAVLLGIDFGSTNIGLALGTNSLVTPLLIINGKNLESAIVEINRAVVENKVEKLIVGLPLTLEEKDTKQSLEIRRFAKVLKVMTKRPVDFQNEYETTRNALEEAIKTDISEKKRKSNDHLAAALILKSYYDEKLNQ